MDQPKSDQLKSDQQLITIRQVAALLAVSVSKVKRMRDVGQLPLPVRMDRNGRMLRWRLRDIEKFIKGL